VEQLKLNFATFSTLSTCKTELPQLVKGYLHDYFLIHSISEVMKVLNKNPNTFEKAINLFDFLENNLEKNVAITWVVLLKEIKKLIDYIGFHKIDIQHKSAKIGYDLFYNYHRVGK